MNTIGFGVPDTTDPHRFEVDIPATRTGVVSIQEHYGIKAGLNGLPEIAERCLLPRLLWQAIADEMKRDFNERLRARKLAPGRWTTGVNLVERLLGKELLVLAWAVERAPAETVPNAIRNWLGLRPEERWWLYTMAAAASGRVEDAEIGWRKALRYALTENPLADPPTGSPPPIRPAVRSRPKPSRQVLPLFADDDPSPLLAHRKSAG